MTEILVRPARKDDIPGIVSVSTTSVTEEEVRGFGTPSSTNPFEDPERLAAAWKEPNVVRGQEILVAEANGEIVGLVTVEDRGTVLELVNIDVPRRLQGRGIGTRIVRSVEDRARREGKEAVTLGTSRSAAGVAWKSLTWWQHLGYRVTHEETNEWTRAIGPGAREIRMRKEITARSDGSWA